MFEYKNPGTTTATHGIYATHASWEPHSTYYGRTIFKATSWITRSVRWFAGDLRADTLKHLKELIKDEATAEPTPEPTPEPDPLDVATCGTCYRAWDIVRHPTPADLCPFCNGDEAAAAPYEVFD